jgi:hypothetical protein
LARRGKARWSERHWLFVLAFALGCVERMRRQNLTNLPVTNSDGRLVGLLLRADADQALEAIRSNAEAPARPRERASLFDSADVTALLAAKLSRPSLHGNRGGPKSACVRL